MPEWIVTTIARWGGVLAGILIAFAATKLGLHISEDQKAGFTEWLTHGLTGFGMLVFMLIYPIVHKLLTSMWAPRDGASKTSVPKP